MEHVVGPYMGDTNSAVLKLSVAYAVLVKYVIPYLNRLLGGPATQFETLPVRLKFPNVPVTPPLNILFVAVVVPTLLPFAIPWSNLL